MDAPVAVDQNDGYTTEWYCTPPDDMNARFQVIRQEWDDDLNVRRIYEIRLAECTTPTSND